MKHLNKNNKGLVGIIIIIVIILAVAIGIAVYAGSYYGSKETITITVDDKWIKGVGSNSQKYLIADVEGNVYENVDDWLQGKYDSSNVWADLKIGETYDVVVMGWRIPFFSMYQNILQIVN